MSMQPHSNDPIGPDGQAAGSGPAGTPPQSPGTPDWQQGLGSAGSAQPVNPAAAPAPEVPASGVGPQTPTVPDWQQGLGTPTASTPSAPAPQAPGASVAPQPAYGSMPDANTATVTPAAKSGFPKLAIATAAVVVVLVLAVVGYFMLAKGNNRPSARPSANNAAQTSANHAKKTAVALDTFTGASLAVPADMSGFNSDIGTTSNHDFLTPGSSPTNGGCELGFGTQTAAQLPGATIDEVVTPGINSLKNSGVTVDGPKAGTALILKDGSGKEYSLPTITYTFIQGSKHGATNYSLAITKDGNRTYVRRACATNGSIDSAKMNLLEQKASQITVTPLP